jgi:hypothetical protein
MDGIRLYIEDVICGKAEGAELRREGFGLLWAEESNIRNEALEQSVFSKCFCIVVGLGEVNESSCDTNLTLWKPASQLAILATETRWRCNVISITANCRSDQHANNATPIGFLASEKLF